jgi:hypothetical protein
MPDSEPLVAAPEASDEPPTAISKVERTQNVEHHAPSISSLEHLLNARKTSGTGAKYWKLLSIKRIPVTENEDSDMLRTDGSGVQRVLISAWWQV